MSSKFKCRWFLRAVTLKIENLISFVRLRMASVCVCERESVQLSANREEKRKKAVCWIWIDTVFKGFTAKRNPHLFDSLKEFNFALSNG